MPARIEPIIVPSLPAPPTRGLTPPTRGLTPPQIAEPRINFPRINLPTSVPQDLSPGKGQNQQPDESEDSDTRELPDPATIYVIPPEPPPVIDIPLTEYAFPAPDAQILSTTASAAFVATTSALAATTALKPVMDSLFKVLKAVFKKMYQKILKKKVKSYSGVETTSVDLPQLDQFRFSSDRPYQGPQYPRKGQRKEKKGA
tara:strand:+ start:492 stop:1094 length:603 start_codon:yes stop_codon:yes gene_type:complete